MPDPTAHADDMKSLAVIEPNTSPALWWVNPWAYALGLKRALDAVYLLSETTEDAYQAATTVIKQKEELADYHRTNLNTFQRKVELALQAVLGKGGHEDTIELVGFAADEIKALREEQKGLLHEARVAIAENETLKAELEKYRLHGSRLQGNHEERIIEDKTAGKYGDLRDGYAAYAGLMLGHYHSPNQEPKPKRKPAKKAKAKKKGRRRA